MASPYKLTGTNTILDLVKAAGTAETYRDSVNKSYAKPWKLFSLPPDSVYQEYKELEHDRDTKRYDIYHNPNPTEGLIKYSQTESDATGVAHDNIDGILAGNRQDKLEKDIAMHGGIGPTPYIQSQEGQQALLDVAMGSAFPGAAIGRLSKAAVTGGSAMFPRLTQSGKYLQQKILPKNVKRALSKPDRPWIKFNEYFKKPSLEWYDQQNELNSARITMEKAMRKWGVKPDERKLMDPVSEVLRTSKYKQN